ncbi:MAG: hypothetical protein ACXWUG_13005 [Polyangiales bacterium]
MPSCADNNQTIFIRQFQEAVAPDCTLTNDPTAKFIFSGFVDLGVTSAYTAFPLIGNQLASKGDAKQSKTEPNRVTIQGAQIELKNLDDSGIAGIDAFTVLATGTVDPAAAGSSDPSYGVSSVQIIPPAVAPALRKLLGTFGASTQIKASIKMFGRTLGNRDVETGTVDFPISICLGCSVFVPAEAVFPGSTKNCKVAISTTPTTTKTSCFNGQDSSTDCRLCQSTVANCRPCSTNDDCAGLRATVDQTKAATCNVSAGFCE